MTAVELIQNLEQRGIRVSVAGSQLAIDGPESALTFDVIEGVRERKAELLTLLAEPRSEHKPSLLSQHIITVHAREWPDGCPLCESPKPCRKDHGLYQCQACGWRFIWQKTERVD